jgi:PKD repeat protein
VDLLVDFSASPLSGNADLIVEFTDLTIGGAVSWLWDFGDGHTSIDQNPSHVYTHSGTYTVDLTVNGVTTGTKTDYITVNLLADFVGSPLYGKIPLSVFFTDRSKGNPSLWAWSFGDGTTLSGTQNPRHNYTQPGIYTVSMVISRGVDTGEETKENYIVVLYPLYTEDIAVPEDRQDLKFMPIQGNGNYLFSKDGIRVVILRSNTSPAGSGFGRPSGPSLIFD